MLFIYEDYVLMNGQRYSHLDMKTHIDLITVIFKLHLFSQ